MERLTFAVKDSKVEGRTLSGTAHVYGTVTTDGRKHSFAPGAFAKSIAAGKLVSRAGHSDSPADLLGSQSAGTLRLTDGSEFTFAIDLPDTQAANDMRSLASRGEPIGMSFAGLGGASRMVKGVRVFTDFDLRSVDPVALPSFEGTSVILNSAQESRKAASTALKIRARVRAVMRRGN